MRESGTVWGGTRGESGIKWGGYAAGVCGSGAGVAR